MPPVVVEQDPVTDGPHGVGLRLKPVPVSALPVKCSDETLSHSVLFRTKWCDELLLEPVAAHEPRAVTAGEHQAIVGAQQQQVLDPAQCTEAGDEGLFKQLAGS